MDVHSRPVQFWLTLAVVPFALAVVVGLIALWPGDPQTEPSRELGRPADLVDATVVSVAVQPCPGTSIDCASALVRVTSGPDKGETVALPDLSFGFGTPAIHSGDKIVVGRTIDPTTGRVDYYFSDFQRRFPLALLALAFAVVVVVVARWRGVAALLGLGFTWIMLVKFVIPAILDGKSPVAVALVGGGAILFVVLYVAHGFNARTTTALLGTLISLALIGVLAALFVEVTHLTGYSSEEATYLQTLTARISLSGLLLGGIVIGSLGVLNDVTVTQASSVWEVHGANPENSVRSLYRSGMRVGRDHIAAVVDTLVLAYAGASLPLLLVFTLASRPIGDVLTGDLIATELVRTFVGSIGLVASVPITTALAALVVSRAGRSGSSEAPLALDAEPDHASDEDVEPET